MSTAPSFEALRRAAFSKCPDHPSGEASDIVLHLPVLEWFAGQCDHVTEFGVRGGESTVALIGSGAKYVRSYDIEQTPIVHRLASLFPPKRWRFTQMDTASEADAFLVEETDLLFLDTLHTFEHVSRELALHGRKARRFLVFHDTTAFEGVLRAVEGFEEQHSGQYRLAYETTWNNGFTVLERFP